MKKNIIYTLCLSLLLLISSCEDYLDKEFYQFTNDNFWTSEENLRAYSQEFYPKFFAGYTQDFTDFGGFFSGGEYTDDFLKTQDRDTKYYFPVNRTTATGDWTKNYTYVRKANVMLAKIPSMPISDEAKNHWMAVGRLFRAMSYNLLVEQYGDVPYIDIAVDPGKQEELQTLYKPRTPRVEVVKHIAEDFKFALENIRAKDKPLQADLYLAGALTSRWMLYHATWLQYHGTTVGASSKAVETATLKELYDFAIQGSLIVMNSGKYGIGNTYNLLFASGSLKDNKEVVFYREYVENKFANALMSYNAILDQEQGGVAQNLIDAYLCADGLPIGQSLKYKGYDNPKISGVFYERDPRLYLTIVDSVRVTNGGVQPASSITGYASKKFLNEEWLAQNSPYVTGRFSIANAPNVRYAEVLLNYVEARYEISRKEIGGAAFSQDDLDKSINLLRKRELTKWGEKTPRTMPALDLAGESLKVRDSGVMIEDPNKDPNVDAILWEIRRERRIELVMEGFRNKDLNRWAKYEYLISATPGATPTAPAIPNTSLLGSWIDKADYPGIKINTAGKDDNPNGVILYNPNGDSQQAGYIYPFPVGNFPARTFVHATDYKYYLKAVPIDQINIYEQAGYTLEQNPGW